MIYMRQHKILFKSARSATSIRLSLRTQESQISAKEDWACCENVDNTTASGLRLELRCKGPALIISCFHYIDKSGIVEPRHNPLSNVVGL